jgi:alkane 1-monooxygenase
MFYFFQQSAIAILLLESVNYIEHYGLERKEKDAGNYVRVTPMHSWNAGYMISNYFLFKLQRHSDHHANAKRRYQILRSFENSPQMPQG